MGAKAKAGLARLGLALLCALAGVLALPAANASATKAHPFKENFGSAAQPAFNKPTAMALDAAGNLLVVDLGGNEEQQLSFPKVQAGDTFKLSNLPASCSASATDPITMPELGLTNSLLSALKAKCGSNFELSENRSGLVTFSKALGNAPQPLLACTVLSGSGSCAVQLIMHGARTGVYRFGPNGEPVPFSALGSNLIDARRGPGGKKLAECGSEPASCDETPQNGFRSGADLGFYAPDVQVAVDRSGTATDGDIYVPQPEASLVDVFAPDGRFLGQLTTAGAESLAKPRGVAVDPTGAVYVSDLANHKIYKYLPTGAAATNAGFTAAFASVELPTDLAAGSGPTAGSLFVNTEGGSYLYKLDSAGGAVKYAVLEGLPTGQNGSGVRAIATDPSSSHLFVLRKGPFELREGHTTGAGFVQEFDASGAAATLVSSTAAADVPQIGVPASIAAEGDLYATYGFEFPGYNGVKLLSASLATFPDLVLQPAGEITPTRATLHATVNPDGAALSECFFEYDGKTAPCQPEAAAIPADSSPHAVSAQVSGLQFNANHLLRIVAADGAHTASPEEVKFSTPNVVKAQPASLITGVSAQLNAAVNPDGAPVTQCRFEYLSGTEFQANFKNEVQKVSLAGATGGSFKLSFNGKQTGAAGEGHLTASSTEVTEVSTASGAFLAEEAISGAGIAPGTNIVAVKAGGKLILSQPTEAAVPPGKTPLGAALPFNASALVVQRALGQVEGLAGAGVSGPAGGPYTVEFSGQVNVPQLGADASGLTPPGAAVTVETLTQGGDGWGPATSAPCAESGAEIGEGQVPVAVHAQVASLQPSTEYLWRAVATTLGSGTGGTGVVAGNPFTTLTNNPVLSAAAGNVTGTAATLNGSVNPQGLAVTECVFEYGETEAYGQSAPCAESGAQIGTGTSPVAVHADIGGLSGASAYHFRLRASNGQGLDKSFQTRGPSVDQQWAASVTTSEATLAATLDSDGKPTTYRLEYGALGQPYEHVLPERGPIGGSEQKVGVFLEGLEPGATYRYRFVATNEDWSGAGPERRFHTYRPLAADTECPNQGFRTGDAAALADCRAYEMVSPVEKPGDVYAPLFTAKTSHRVRLDQAAPDGAKLTYSAFFSPFAEPEAAPAVSQYLAERDPARGWGTRSISAPRTSVSRYFFGKLDSLFKAFSPDLCHGWFIQDTDLLLAPGAAEGFPNLYRRDLCGAEGYEALTTAAPPNPELGDTLDAYIPTFQAASADGSLAVFRAPAPLTPDASPALGNQLYAAQGGTLRLLSVLPDGSANGSSSLGRFGGVDFAEDNVRHALSEDGSRAFWEGSRRLYLRLNPFQPPSALQAGQCTEPAKACTLPVSEPVSSEPASFQAAAADGSVAYFTVGGKLYEFDTARAIAHQPEAARLVAAGVTGFMGASEDGSRVYFASHAELTAEPNPEGVVAGGKHDLYLYERGGGFAFIGTLSEEDLFTVISTDNPSSPLAEAPYQRASRVSPDGLHAAFASSANPTGYDNHDLQSGHPDTEVYLYDAASEGEEARLRCASCNPSGTRPTGREEAAAGNTQGTEFWTASTIPGWPSDQQPSRALSENGRRLFFESYDALLPTDTDGVKDVYEWEAPGEGSCGTEDADYFAADEGCISLVSTGTSVKESGFIDASADGSDVFFETASSLLARDTGLIDIYDARAGGGFPEPPPPVATCEGEACQSSPEAPNDPTPSSESFQGAGNVREEAPKPSRPCAKGKVRRHGKCIAKKHRKRARRHRRAAR